MYKKKYRVETTRLINHAYNNGMYFVTICTRKKLQWFGEIKDGEMKLTPLGIKTNACIQEIPKHFPQASIDAFIIMPNHVHMIVKIIQTLEASKGRDAKFCVSTEVKQEFGPQSKNLSSIIRGFKIGVKKAANELNLPFLWQPRYHDHIIRSENELVAIRSYIKSNPDTWDKETIPWHDDAHYVNV